MIWRPKVKRQQVGLFCLFSLVAAVIAVSAAPAQANSIIGATNATGCSGGLNMMDPNDSHINYKRSNLSTGGTNAVNWVMSNRINPTDLSSGHTSSTSAADVVISDDWWADGFCNVTVWGPNKTIGKAICEVKIGAACT